MRLGVVVRTNQRTPHSMADLIEYCWGNESTTWGRRRHDDGHPRPYRLKHIELGNEQFNTFFVEQVAAMEKRAEEVGVGGQLYYISPANGMWFTGNSTEGNAAEALGMADHLLEDFHVGAGGAVSGSRALFANNTGWHEGSVNLETNAGSHDMGRALAEAADLNVFFSQFIPSTGPDRAKGIGRIKARTASFCGERSGYA